MREVSPFLVPSCPAPVLPCTLPHVAGQGRCGMLGPRPGAQAQLCSHREDSRACVIEQLCYSCRVNMKDVVSPSHPRVVIGEAHPWGPVATQLLIYGHSLLQPSLDPLPPYILAEAQLRSQRYGLATWLGECWRGPSRHWPPWGRVPRVWLPPGPRRRSRSIWWRAVTMTCTPAGAEPGSPRSRRARMGRQHVIV